MGRIVQTTVDMPYPLRAKRNVQIYLPKNYAKRKDERFPVLYMHDGQNLFYNAASFGGVSWGVKQTMETAERQGVGGMIVVGIENAGDDRMKEYAAFAYEESSGETAESHGIDYVDWIVHTLKPQVDKAFRTLPGADTTFMAGSSAGANISFYAGIAYPEVFSRIGLFSTAIWLFQEPELRQFLKEKMKNTHAFADRTFFIQCGTEEGGRNRALSQAYIDAALWLSRSLLTGGIRPDQIDLLISQGLAHHERAWRSVFPQFLQFLYAK